MMSRSGSELRPEDPLSNEEMPTHYRRPTAMLEIQFTNPQEIPTGLAVYILNDDNNRRQLELIADHLTFSGLAFSGAQVISHNDDIYLIFLGPASRAVWSTLRRGFLLAPVEDPYGAGNEERRRMYNDHERAFFALAACM